MRDVEMQFANVTQQELRSNLSVQFKEELKAMPERFPEKL